MPVTPDGYLPFLEAVQQIGQSLVPGWQETDTDQENRSYSATDQEKIEFHILVERCQVSFAAEWGRSWDLLAYHYVIATQSPNLEWPSAGYDEELFGNLELVSLWRAKAGDAQSLLQYGADYIDLDSACKALTEVLIKRKLHPLWLEISLDQLLGDKNENDLPQIIRRSFIEIIEEEIKTASLDADKIALRRADAHRRVSDAFQRFRQKAGYGQLSVIYLDNGTIRSLREFWRQDQAHTALEAGGYIGPAKASAFTAIDEPPRSEVKDTYVDQNELRDWLKAEKRTTKPVGQPGAFSEAKVKEWFRRRQIASPEKTRPLDDWLDEAMENFPRQGSTPRLSKSRAGKICKSLYAETGAKWSQVGRPKGSKKRT